MKNLLLSDGEWKLMNLLWAESPLTIREMVTALEGDTAWTKATVNMMLNRLAEKGVVQIDASERRKRFYPLLSREDAVRQEAKNTLEKIKADGLGLMLSAMAQECTLSEEELDELTRILKGARRDHG